ncbi:MAG: PhnD/SsuA/transferrin family substrate-binding protein [Chloroflexota bacterium]
MNQLKMMTCLGENTVPVCAEIAAEMSERLGVEVVFKPVAESTPAAEKLMRGDVQLGWICGLLYVHKVDSENAQLDLLSAPIFSGHTEPVYFSNLTVATASPFKTIEDLSGHTLAINETTSWSGNHLLRAFMHERGLDMSFFDEVVVSGGHSKSFAMVAEGKVDAASIDHSVFDFVAEHRPELLERIRVIDLIGPSPAPPFVVHRSVSEHLRYKIRDCLLELGKDSQFISRVQPHRVETFVPISDADYQPIREGFARSLSMDCLDTNTKTK